MNKRRLGRGLEACSAVKKGDSRRARSTLGELIQIAVDQIDPNPFQPRRQFDPAEIAALADSLRQHGMLQPVLVRAMGDRYQLIAGERRLRASIEAQLHEVPARVLELDDQRVFEMAMVENLQREDLNAIDKASAFREYLSRYGGTQEELAGRLGLDRSTVSNLIRLLELPGEVLDAVRVTEITQGHARPCSACPTRKAGSPPTRIITRTPFGAPDRGSRRHAVRPHHHVPGSAKTRPTITTPDPPIFFSSNSVSCRPWARQFDQAKNRRSRPDHHRLPLARRVRSSGRAFPAGGAAVG